jgi:hypothetical protein
MEEDVSPETNCNEGGSYSLVLDVGFCLILVDQAVVIAALMIDAFVEMVHNSHHGRFLRALRPLFLFDVYYLAGLRRYTICHI